MHSIVLKTQELIRSQQRIDHLFAMVDPADSSYFEISSYWAQYLVIRISGFMEESVECVFSNYVNRSSSPNTSSFAKRHIRKSKANPNYEKLKAIVSAFDQGWSSSFDEFIKQEGRLEALNSLMTLRHKVAHGDNLSISLSNVRDYYSKCLEIVQFLEELVELQ